MRILGCGWAKTGTSSLGEALKLLGFDHRSQDLSLVRHLPNTRPILEKAKAQSFEDWPWLLLFREFDEAFPECRFILTVRDSKRWLASYRKHIDDLGRAPPAMNAIREKLYGLKFPNPSDLDLIERYQRHNREVCEHFAERPDKLLVVDWEAGDGWNEVCSFLQRPIPSVPFPKANTASSRKPPAFTTKLRRIISGAFR
jgi:hypothetical protein